MVSPQTFYTEWGLMLTALSSRGHLVRVEPFENWRDSRGACEVSSQHEAAHLTPPGDYVGWLQYELG